jgi:hypothetical protein
VVPVPIRNADRFAALVLEEGQEFVPQPVRPPAWVDRATAWLPDFNYDAVFCDPATRPIVMLMSVSAIVVAVVLFRPREPRTAPAVCGVE